LNVTPAAAPGPAGVPPAARAAGDRHYHHMRASSADLDRSLEVLKRSFAEGRLTIQELDQRLTQAFSSRFFAELMALTADLPVGIFGRLPAHPVTLPPPRKRRPAVIVVAWAVVLAAVLAGLLAA
jgi:hypothetical protein